MTRTAGDGGGEAYKMQAKVSLRARYERQAEAARLKEEEEEEERRRRWEQMKSLIRQVWIACITQARVHAHTHLLDSTRLDSTRLDSTRLDLL